MTPSTTTVSTRPHRGRCMLRLLAASILILAATTAQAGSVIMPRILLHLRRVELGATCAPELVSCAGAEINGQVSNPSGVTHFYYIYLLAAGYDVSTGVQEIHAGIDYDWTTLSGVDIFSWTLCADQEDPGPGWYNQGGDNRISWTAGHCPHDSVAVAGYFYTAAYSPGRLALVPLAGGPATLSLCGGSPEAVDKTRLGLVGFGGLGGCNPCSGPCDYVAVTPSTWSGLKLIFRTP